MGDREILFKYGGERGRFYKKFCRSDSSKLYFINFDLTTFRGSKLIQLAKVVNKTMILLFYSLDDLMLPY